MPKCQENNCETRAKFNNPGSKPAIYCSKHKKDGMIDIYRKFCEEEGCHIRPNFNIKGETTAIYCSKHKKPGMIDVKHKKCLFDGCSTIPHYNYKNETTPIYCSKHKKPGMINIKDKTCLFDGCSTRPSFNIKGETTSIYCSKHKKPGMIDVKNKTCLFDGCSTQPYFNIKGETTGIYCSKHKKSGMIDVKHKKCNFDNCGIRVHYGYIGHKPSRCFSHKDDNMITNSRRRCKQKDCDYFASYGLKPNCQEYCSDHAPEKYICLTNRKCKNAGKDPICLEIDILNDKGLCRECDPADHFKFRRKAKEELVKTWLDYSDHKDYITYDKAHPEFRECFGKKYRPDFLYDCSTHYVVLEVDENQHRGRTYECDQKRMCEIAQSLGIHTIFIRYNPDQYKTDKHKYSPSDAKRKEYLMRVLKYCKEEIPDEDTSYLRLVKLYFDGFKESDFKLEDIDIYELAKVNINIVDNL